ncbi:MAG: cytochrome c [Betaproteobacteria bacterium]|nr:cytochrome c [Betaproteobacteria bacterium]
MLRQDCGACHGIRLTGGLGPPLTAEALYDKPADSMTETILSGRPGTAMPPWRHFMTETEAAWLVARLRNGTIDAPDSR